MMSTLNQPPPVVTVSPFTCCHSFLSEKYPGSLGMNVDVFKLKCVSVLVPGPVTRKSAVKGGGRDYQTVSQRNEDVVTERYEVH
uniref:Uncharacterized protein n=1 Tax=Steinernema glaseri TaxID=37863 RepID=A0A1I7ZM68_9BILA